jgi:uncharacterized protein
MSNQVAVTFACEDFELEGILHIPDGKVRRSLKVVVCHPHPVFGGSMDNMVVQRICEAVAERGVEALRFNFRGVGASGGFHNAGVGEVKDVLAAVKYLRNGKKSLKVGLSGYSFGASMAVLAAKKDKTIERVATVALPLRLKDVGPPPTKRPKMLLIAGKSDLVAPISELEVYAKASRGNAKLEPIPGADHFFGGKMLQVGKLVADFLVGASKE